MLTQAVELEMSGVLDGPVLLVSQAVSVWPGGRVRKPVRLLQLLLRLVCILIRSSMLWPSSGVSNLPVMMRHQGLFIW